MHFFGSIGGGLILLGIVILAYLSAIKIFNDVVGIAERPAFYLGILAIIVGVQLFIAGFLGDLVSRNAPDKNAYQVEKELG
jgi:hypothetical protein